MSVNRFRVVTGIVVAAAASVLLVAPAAAGKKPLVSVAQAPAPSSCRLESGASVAKVREAPMQWSYVLTADPSGRHGAAHGSIDVGVYTPGLDESIDFSSPLLIDVVMTSPDTATFNSVWYGIKKTPGPITSSQIVYIGVDRGELKCVSPRQWNGTHTIAFFGPESDANNDGFPDPGATPMAPPVTVHTIDTRLGQ